MLYQFSWGVGASSDYFGTLEVLGPIAKMSGAFTVQPHTKLFSLSHGMLGFFLVKSKLPQVLLVQCNDNFGILVPRAW